MLRTTRKFLSLSGRKGVAAAASLVPSLKSQQAISASRKDSSACASASPMLAPMLNPQVTSAAFRELDSRMIRNFSLDKVLSEVSYNDVVVARQELNGKYSFIGFKDVAALDVSRCLLFLPEHMRHFHTVCAREGAPCDFYADVDLSLHDDGEAILLQITDRLEAILEFIKFGEYKLVILQSPSSEKQSYHIHVRGATSTFSDYRAVREIATSINTQLGAPHIDCACYRSHGTLRTAFCAKVGAQPTSGGRTTHLLPLEPASAALQKRLAAMRTMSAEELFEASLVSRQIPTESFPMAEPLRLFNGVGKSCRLAKALLEGEEGVGADGEAISKKGNQMQHFLREDVKWLRYKEAVKKMRQLPASFAEDYLTWISVGLALRSFGAENHIFDQWVAFSSKCPEKFSRDECQKKWISFGHGKDEDTWRKGYNYLNTTVWRSAEGAIRTDDYRPRL